MNFL
jgi:Protein of unknown function (DUF2384)